VTFKPVKDGHMYLVMQNVNVDSIGININGTVTNYTGLKNGNHIIDIGYVTITDTIEAYADSSMNLLVYTLENDKFTEAYKILNTNGLNVTSSSDTKIEGNLNATYDGTMLFSIPYDAGWSVYVDGKKADTFAIKNALLGINLSAGQHTIVLKYTPVGLIKGCILTFICIMILIGIGIFNRLRKRGRIQTTKLPLLIQEYISEEDVILNRPKKFIMTQSDINSIMNKGSSDDLTEQSEKIENDSQQ
jgi:uncharacterized membrane protein YfhO